MKYIKLFENFKEEITFEILNSKDLNYSYFINEEYGWRYSKYKKDNNTQVDLFDGDKDKFIIIEDAIKEYIDEINPFTGEFINPRNNQHKVFEYVIEPTEHFIIKFLRKKYEDPDGSKGYENPELYEGINLLYKNKNNVTRFVETNAIEIDKGTLVKASDKSGYNIIFALKRLGKKKYEIVLCSQMKGKQYDGFQGRIIKLHPNGDK